MPREEKGQLPVRLPLDMKQDIAIVAAALGMSSNEAFVEAGAQWLKDRKSRPEVQEALARLSVNE